MTSKILGLLAVGLLAGPNGAYAVIVGGTFEFTAAGFAPVFDPAEGVPVDPVFGAFTVTFDNSTDIFDSTEGFELHALNLDVQGPSGYSYFVDFDVLQIGGLLGFGLTRRRAN